MKNQPPKIKITETRVFGLPKAPEPIASADKHDTVELLAASKAELLAGIDALYQFAIDDSSKPGTKVLFCEAAEHLEAAVKLIDRSYITHKKG